MSRVHRSYRSSSRRRMSAMRRALSASRSFANCCSRSKYLRRGRWRFCRGAAATRGRWRFCRGGAAVTRGRWRFCRGGAAVTRGRPRLLRPRRDPRTSVASVGFRSPSISALVARVGIKPHAAGERDDSRGRDGARRAALRNGHRRVRALARRPNGRGAAAHDRYELDRARRHRHSVCCARARLVRARLVRAQLARAQLARTIRAGLRVLGQEGW